MHRTVYGLLDASRAYFLRQDPATFVKTNKGEFEVAFASHVDDILLVGDTKTLNETHQSMSQQLQYGEVQSIPARFLGMNLSRNVNGDIIIDQKH